MKVFSRIWICWVTTVMLLACGGVEPVFEPESAAPMKTTMPPRAGAPLRISDVRQTWQWQLTGEIDLGVAADVFDLDLFDTDEQIVADLHAAGSWVICYINVGAWEDWREDRNAFPESLLGKAYEGWEGERWLDIRQIDLLAAIIGTRFDLCQEKGFDAIEPDNIDGYSNDTGFPLSYDDQIRYNRWLAEEAHRRGLLIGLKNDPEQAADLVGEFDWAMTEDCFDEGWCEQMAGFVEKGKPVFSAEYTDTRVDFEAACTEAERLQFNLILKQRELGAFRKICD